VVSIRRRAFIALLGGAATSAWPLAARAQQPPMPVVGFLRSMTSADSGHLVAAFRQGLRTARSNTAGPRINRRWSPICHASAPGSGASGGRREAHSMRDSAQVTAPGAVTSTIVAVSTRPNRQNRSTCSRMSGPLVHIQMLRLVNRFRRRDRRSQIAARPRRDR
jgi:hypothetical protein